jgi:hypothetical protein
MPSSRHGQWTVNPGTFDRKLPGDAPQIGFRRPKSGLPALQLNGAARSAEENSGDVMNRYPLRIEARRDESLSRWLWLVKWLLLIPHVFVLAVLWVGFVVLTLVAYLAVLFTGRYPHAIFSYNVGVLRWSWRVGYGYEALGTDRYPPFTLADVPDYPARLTVTESPRPPRWLPLVAWLFAIPHVLLLGGLTGAATWKAPGPQDHLCHRPRTFSTDPARGRDDVDTRRTCAARVLVRPVQHTLVVGVRMHGGQETMLDAERLVQHLGQRRDAVRRARRGGDDAVPHGVAGPVPG